MRGTHTHRTPPLVILEWGHPPQDPSLHIPRQDSSGNLPRDPSLSLEDDNEGGCMRPTVAICSENDETGDASLEDDSEEDDVTKDLGRRYWYT